MKKLLKSFFFTLLIISIFSSCQTDEISKEDKIQDGVVENKLFKSSNIEENILEFIKIDESLNEKIDNMLSFNPDFKFDSNFNNELINCKSENDIELLFLNSGLTNGNEILKLLKEKVNYQNLFRNNNDAFYQKPLTERNDIAINVINTYTNQPKIKTNYVVLSCSSDWHEAIRRCDRDYMIGAAAAIVGAAWGLAPGLIAAAQTMISRHYCASDAQYEYWKCDRSLQ